jgi:hypothetical protein
MAAEGTLYRPDFADSIGLEGVFDAYAGFSVFLLKFDGSAEEIEPHKGRLSTLPGLLTRGTRWASKSRLT